MQAKDNDSPQNGGGHPWSIQPGTASTLLLFNHSADTTRRFNVLIGTEKAEQWQKSYYLAPLETKAISINEIVEKQMADEKGHTLPKDAVAGQVTWFTRSPKWGKGRLMVSQPQQGMARSFSCGTCADVCPDGYFSPFSFQDIVPTGSGPIGYMVVSECTHACSINSCTGPKIGQTTDVTYRWSSSNSSIATVSGGLHCVERKCGGSRARLDHRQCHSPGGFLSGPGPGADKGAGANEPESFECSRSAERVGPSERLPSQRQLWNQGRHEVSGLWTRPGTPSCRRP